MLRLFPFLFAGLLATVANAQHDTCTATPMTVGQHVGAIGRFARMPASMSVCTIFEQHHHRHEDHTGVDGHY